VDRDELLTAGDRNLAAVLRHAARTTPGGVLDDGDENRLVMVSTLRTWPGPYHNGVLRLDRSLAPDEVLERAAAFFAGRVRGYSVWIGAHADADLEGAALDAGLAQVSATGAPRMAIDHLPAAQPAPEGVVLTEVVDEAGRQAYADVTAEAYADALLPADVVHVQLANVEALCGPGVRSVVASDGGRPVAAAMVVVSEGLAGVQLVGTIPDARGRGLGELCTRWTVQAGFELGAIAAVLEASEAGEPLYLRMGFEEVSRYRWCFGSPP